MSEQENSHWNKPQIKEALIDAHIGAHVWGRRTGKTVGPLTRRVRHNVHSMPGSVGVNVAETFQQILTRTLPQIVSSLARQKYYQDVHYVIGHPPPKKWNWPKPLLAPMRFEYFMWWYTGAGLHLVSQDRPGSSNGLDVDYVLGDEVKFLKRERLEQELLPTLSGNPVTRAKYAHLPEFKGITFTTDMPTSRQGRWILDYEKQMDEKAIKLILSIQKDLFDPDVSEFRKQKLLQLLQELRKDLVYFSKASTVDNIEIVGEDYIRQQRRILPAFIYNTAILNKEPKSIEDTFYGFFNDEYHCYTNYAYDTLENIGYDFEKLKSLDCRQDADLDYGRPLQFVMDYGGSINCLIAFQVYENEIRFLKSFYQKHPSKPKDVVKQFCDYYRIFSDHQAIYRYDHTAINSQLMTREEVIDTLIAEGWECDPIYIGQAPDHEDKHRLINDTFREDLPYPHIRINKYNCAELIMSLQQAPIKQGSKGFEKDKSSEKKPDEEYPQEEATHFSDAFDTAIWSIVSPIAIEPESYDITIFGR